MREWKVTKNARISWDEESLIRYFSSNTYVPSALSSALEKEWRARKMWLLPSDPHMWRKPSCEKIRVCILYYNNITRRKELGGLPSKVTFKPRPEFWGASLIKSKRKKDPGKQNYKEKKARRLRRTWRVCRKIKEASETQLQPGPFLMPLFQSREGCGCNSEGAYLGWGKNSQFYFQQPLTEIGIPFSHECRKQTTVLLTTSVTLSPTEVKRSPIPVQLLHMSWNIMHAHTLKFWYWLDFVTRSCYIMH